MTVNRVMLGGVNMVDMGAWDGNYTGTVVTGNTFLTTSGSMIKIGVPMGPNLWAAVNSTSYRTANGQVTNNRFVSTTGGYFGYAMCAQSLASLSLAHSVGRAVSGHNNSVVSGNDVSQADFGGIPSAWCISSALPPRTQAPGIWYDPWTSSGDWSGQPNAVPSTLIFLICVMENAVRLLFLKCALC